MKRELETLKRKATENITDEAGAILAYQNDQVGDLQMEQEYIIQSIFCNKEKFVKGSKSHRVNGIVVQTNFYGPHLSRADLPHIEKLKQRSVTIEDRGLEVYVAGARVGPQPLTTREHCIQETKEAALLARKKTMVWALARQTDPENQTIPSWTGFNISTRDQEPISQDIVGYLPTINSPGTELNTVFEILKQSELIKKELHLETIVVVMDQALYAKAAEITWKHRGWFSNILLRVGTFHTICNALAIIGKRFRDAGLKDMHRGWSCRRGVHQWSP
ncbi:uncharacterized protein LOC118494938 [Sander lucioperca]|uniref:uncharacterized protein LOC118494938 n=1 Tax=Sander lucioperca TaxID=283035 RepID=UPI001653CD9C|nr:uncharacterized protein LOC118494938 [Sander lucioperca]